MSTRDADAAAALQRVRRSPLYQRVRTALGQWQMRAGSPAAPWVLVACSGGPDSTALLVLVWAMQAEGLLVGHVVCVDHQLRPQSAVEAEQVCAVAARLGLSSERVAVVCPPGPSRMAAARAVRYAALVQAAQRRGAQAILVAHTQEDQSETMLMRWLGGAGLLGLCGMEAQRELLAPDLPVGSLTLLRPLLTTQRAELERLLEQTASQVAPLPVYDPSNDDRHYQRPRLRHELLPLLRREQPQLDNRLTQLASQLRADEDYLDQQAAQAYAALRRQAEPDAARSGAGICLPLAATAALPPALFARVMRRAAGGGLGHLHITALAALCSRAAGTQVLDLPGGWRAERRYTELRFFRRASLSSKGPDDAAAHWIPACGQYRFPQGTLSLHWESAQVSPEPSPGAGSAAGQSGTAAAGRTSADRIRFQRTDEVLLAVAPEAFPLLVRSPRPGDRIRLSPRGGHRKLSDLLIDLKVPRPARSAILLLCRGEEILWVIGHRQAALPAVAETPALSPLPSTRPLSGETTAVVAASPQEETAMKPELLRACFRSVG